MPLTLQTGYRVMPNNKPVNKPFDLQIITKKNRYEVVLF